MDDVSVSTQTPDEQGNSPVVMSGECAMCSMPGEIQMSAITSEGTKRQALVYTFFCKSCGHQQREVKYAAGFSKIGQKITVQIRDVNDLQKISVVHSANCEVTIPEIGLEFQGGPTAGTFSSILQVVQGIYQDVKNNPCLSSARKSQLDDFLENIANLSSKFPWKIIFDDPDSNSFVDIENLEPEKNKYVVEIEDYEKDENGKRKLLKIESSLSDQQKFDVLNGKISLEGIAEKIAQGKIKNVVMLTGAGVSTNAGIPDWRSGKGIYTKIDPDHHTLEMYKKDPWPVLSTWKLFLPVMEGKIKPTKAHKLIQFFQEKNILLRYYTQNIDTLEDQLTGIPSEKIVRVHGSMKTSVCLECGVQYNDEDMKEMFWKVLEKDKVPHCTKCSSTLAIKPNIVFFGESLPSSYVNFVNEDFKNCDLLIILGTSLKVFPVAGLPDLVGENVPRLLINKDCVGPFVHGVKQSELEISDPGLPGTYRDVAFIGDIDIGVDLLVKGIEPEKKL